MDDLSYALEAGDLREALEATKPDTVRLWTKERMVEQLAVELACRATSEEELDQAIRFCINNILWEQGWTQTNDLNVAKVRRVWLEAHFKVWCERLKGSPPTPQEFVKLYGEIIRALGDEPRYGLPPKRNRRTKPAKPSASIIPLLAQACDPSREGNADDNDEDDPA